MKRLTPNGFTLVEMVVVIAVVIILAAFTLSLAAHFNRRGYELKTLGEIHAVQVACDAFRNDQGAFPQNTDTDTLDPRIDASPAAPKYQKASLHLYSSLTGDFLPAGAPDGRPESGNAVYLAFKPNQLAYTGGTTGGAVAGIQDPFGAMYGYSTAASRAEVAYREALKTNPNTARPAPVKGYNPTFDFWSTGGGTTLLQQSKWLKNWVE